jgi:hypothetical protein
MVTADTLQPAPGESAAFVAGYAYANGERVAIPDLGAIESALLESAWGEPAARNENGHGVPGHTVNTAV